VILRILRGHVASDDLGRLVDAVRLDLDDWTAIDAGPTWAQPSFRSTGDGAEFLLASLWLSAEAVLAQGGDVSEPRGRLAASGLLRDARAQHYELVLEGAAGPTATCELLRLSSIDLVARRSSAFYEHVRELWDELSRDVGLVALRVGRRVSADGEQAVVISAWETAAALDSATSGGFVGGEEMGAFYASPPVIEHFTALLLDPEARLPT